MKAAAHRMGGLQPHHDLRAQMFAQLDRCKGLQAALLRLRVRCAPDCESLWHLRVPLVQALAAEYGESDARRSLVSVDGAFRDAWPDAPVSLPGALR